MLPKCVLEDLPYAFHISHYTLYYVWCDVYCMNVLLEYVNYPVGYTLN